VIPAMTFWYHTRKPTGASLSGRSWMLWTHWLTSVIVALS